MTQDQIIEMAVAAGIIPWTKHEHVGGNNFSASDEGLDGDLASLIQFAKLVAAKEREACAKVCEAGINNATDWDSSAWDQACENRAYAIRSRGRT